MDQRRVRAHSSSWSVRRRSDVLAAAGIDVVSAEEDRARRGVVAAHPADRRPTARWRFDVAEPRSERRARSRPITSTARSSCSGVARHRDAGERDAPGRDGRRGSREGRRRARSTPRISSPDSALGRPDARQVVGEGVVGRGVRGERGVRPVPLAGARRADRLPQRRVVVAESPDRDAVQVLAMRDPRAPMHGTRIEEPDGAADRAGDRRAGCVDARRTSPCSRTGPPRPPRPTTRSRRAPRRVRSPSRGSPTVCGAPDRPGTSPSPRRASRVRTQGCRDRPCPARRHPSAASTTSRTHSVGAIGPGSLVE